MREKLLVRHKRGVSEIVSYALLIMIAVAVSTLVYVYLQTYIPKEKPVCKEDAFITISMVSCDVATKTINLTLVNKGLFTLDAAYVRLAPQGKEIAIILNEPTVNANNFYLSDGSSFTGLEPNKQLSRIYPAGQVINGSGSYRVEVQPAMGKGTKLALCPTIASQTITCV